jgi:hypothetical protein
MMGNSYQTDASSTSGKATISNSSEQAPAPKQAADGKPTIGAPGIAPRPKSSASSDSTAAQVGTAATGRLENPTYADARSTIDEYFRREGEAAEQFWKAANAGFTAFNTYSSKSYNQTSSTAFQLFEAAIGTVGATSAVLGILKAITTGERVAKLVETAEKAKTWAERSGGIKEGIEKAKAIPETRESETEAKEHGNFEVEHINSLVELSAANLKSRWTAENKIRAALAAVKYSDASVDLSAMVESAIGHMPQPEDIDAIQDAVSQRFEYSLYYEYFVESGKAILEVDIDDDDGSTKSGIRGVPEAVIDRVMSLGQFDDFKQGAAAFHKEVRHLRSHGTKI